MFTSAALAYVISAVVPKANTQLAAVVFVLFLLRIWDLQDLEWLRFASFMRWAQEAFYLEDYLHDTTTKWDPDGLSTALGWLWGWGWFLRLVAFCVTWQGPRAGRTGREGVSRLHSAA
eukprot:gene18915-65878_t